MGARDASLIAVVFLASCHAVLGLEEGHRLPDAGSGSGGTSGTGGGTTATGIAGGGGGGVTVEVCSNGVDDDADGAIDCEDDDCSDYECVQVPAGWHGPILIVEDAAEVDCPFGTSRILGGEGIPIVPPAECAPCGCDLTNNTCEASVELFGSAGCASTSVGAGPGSGCMDIDPDVSGITSAQASVASGSAGTCVSSGGGLATPVEPPQFVTTYQQCELASGGGCGSGACVGQGGQDWSRPCIYQTGDTACDTQPFTDKLLIDTITHDDRSCTPCTCAEPTPCNERSILLFTADNCGGSPQYVPLDGSCEGFSPRAVNSASFNAGASCDSQGGDPTGSLTLETRTVCCLPPI